jgi:putative membrane protein
MKLLNDEEHKRVEAAIQKAESTTSGEIVFVTADASDQYQHATLQGTVFGMAIVTAIYMLIPYIFPAAADLTFFSHTDPNFVTHLLWTEFLSFAFFYVALPYFPCRRLLISKQEMDARVRDAAFMQFYAGGLYRTLDSNGVEIFLSLFERQVVVIGDRGINEKMGEQHWEKVRDSIVQGIKKGNACAGVCAAIEICGQALAQHFPIKPDDVNELPNRVIHRPLNPQ